MKNITPPQDTEPSILVPILIKLLQEETGTQYNDLGTLFNEVIRLRACGKVDISKHLVDMLRMVAFEANPNEDILDKLVIEFYLLRRRRKTL